MLNTDKTIINCWSARERRIVLCSADGEMAASSTATGS